jgi:adenylate cyclase
MGLPQTERKLAAILAADVVGYSRLMGIDEEGTLAQLRAHRRALIDPKIKERHGRIVKTTGDGMLVEFASAVDAVRCAVEIQRGMTDRNARAPPERRIDFRVGINLGDIIFENRDIFGDGVNIAARLEGLAEPAGICVSRKVRDEVRDKLDVAFDDMGDQQIKNIARPVRCFRLSFDDYKPSSVPLVAATGWPRRKLVVALAATVGVLIGAGLWLRLGGVPPPQATSATALVPGSIQNTFGPTGDHTSRLSIIVLPFANLGGDLEQNYFADGLTDDITTDLSRISGSLVISRNSAFTYRDKSVDPKQVARELAVRYVLEGSVRRIDNQVRVNAQLIDGETGGHLWTERFDHDLLDIAAFQDEVTGRVASALSLELVANESRKSLRARPNNPDAVDLTMRGRSLMNKPPDKERTLEARRLFERALSMDRQSADALVGLAQTYTRIILNAWSDDHVEDLQRADDVLTRALAINPRSAVAYSERAVVLVVREQIPEAIAACETAIALDRNFAGAYGFLAGTMWFARHPERSPALIEQAIRLSPRDPLLSFWLLNFGRAQADLGQTEAAIENLRKAVASNPSPAWMRISLAAVYARSGRNAEARDAMDDALRMMPGYMARQPEATIKGMRAQIELALHGYDPGGVDGWIGPTTRRALTGYQSDQGLPPSGKYDDATLERLGVSPSPAP